jgi:hypothetical protein
MTYALLIGIAVYFAVIALIDVLVLLGKYGVI